MFKICLKIELEIIYNGVRYQIKVIVRIPMITLIKRFKKKAKTNNKII